MKYKVYIIDEVHMLSNSAFNALLKTLEEPPEHVKFILATTEPQKLPATILSRCQRFDFKKIKTKDIIKRLKFILEKENKELSDEIIDFIAMFSDGGLRDAINLLDQVLSLNNKDIKIEDVYNLIGLYNEDKLLDLFDSIFEGNIEESLKFLEEFNDENKNYIYLCDKLIEILKNILIFDRSNDYFTKTYEDKIKKYTMVDVNKIYETLDLLLKLDTELRKTINQKLIFEVYLVKINTIFNNYVYNLNKNTNNLEEDVNLIVDKYEQKMEIKEEKKNEMLDEIKNIRINNSLAGANKELKNEFVNKFDEINDYISQKEYTSISNLLIKSTPEVVSDKNVLFTFKKDIDANLFNLNTEEVKKLLKKIYNKKLDVIALTNDEWEVVKNDYIKNIKNGVKYTYVEEKEKKKKKSSVLQTSIEDIFGNNYSNEE